MTVRDGEDPALPEGGHRPPRPMPAKLNISAPFDTYATDDLGPVQPARVSVPDHTIRGRIPSVKEWKESLPDRTAADILDKMAATFRERQKTYGSNFKMVAPIMAILFPNGLPSNLAFQHKFHLFELIIVKLSRFAISELSHEDSIHDLGVYAAMVEACLLEENKS